MSNQQPKPTLPETCNIYVIGDGKIGKTCLLHYYAKNVFLGDTQEYVRTLFEKYVAEVEVRLPRPPSESTRKSIISGSKKDGDLSVSEVETVYAASKAFDALFTQPYAADVSQTPSGRGPEGTLTRLTERVNLSLYDTAGQEEYGGLRKMLYDNKDEAGADLSNASSGKSSRKQSAVERNRRPTGPSKTTAALTASVETKRGPPIVVVCFAWDDPNSLNNVEMKWNKELQVIQQSLSSFSTAANSGHRPFVVVLCATKMDMMVSPNSTATTAADSPTTTPHCKWQDVLAVKRNIGADVFVPCSAKTGHGVKQVFEAGLLVWATRAREEAALKAGQQRSSGGCELM